MVYFELSKLGFNCGYDKKECNAYPMGCSNCIKNRLKELGFDISLIRINEMDSEEKILEMHRENIWNKFKDVLNLRHIVIISKSGVPILNYPVSGGSLDANMLSGFIQANVIFSESGTNGVDSNSQNQNQGSSSSGSFEGNFYEFQYKDFNILLKSGWFLRFCLILDQKASQNLRNTLNQFQKEYEMTFNKEIQDFEKKNLLNFEKTIDFIIRSFDVQLVFPITVSHTIPPDLSEKINQNLVQRSIIKLSKEMLSKKPFFFVNSLLNKVQEILSNLPPNVILYEIYKLMELNVLYPTSLEETQSKLLSFKENEMRRLEKGKVISSITTSNDMENFYKQVAGLDSGKAKQLMQNLIKKGKAIEKDQIYQEAVKEYQKALFIAQKMGFTDDIGKISFLIMQAEDKNKQVQLEYALISAENAEKKKDYITSIGFYKQAEGIITTYFENNKDFESKLKKIRKKINKLQSNL